MNREQEKRRLRAGAFMVNNGRVLMTINLLREKYNALRSVEKGLKAEGIERQEFIDSVNFLHEEGYIYLRDMESREPANLADVEYQTLEAKVTGKSEGADQRNGGSGEQKLLRRTGECLKRSFWSFKNIFKQGRFARTCPNQERL